MSSTDTSASQLAFLSGCVKAEKVSSALVNEGIHFARIS